MDQDRTQLDRIERLLERIALAVERADPPKIDLAQRLTLSLPEAGRVLGVPEGTVRQLVAGGQLAAVHIDPNRIVIPVDGLQAFARGERPKG